MKCSIKHPKYCTVIKTLASPQLGISLQATIEDSVVQYLPGLKRVDSQQLSATISPMEIVAECFINTDMYVSTESIGSNHIRFIAWKLHIMKFNPPDLYQ